MPSSNHLRSPILSEARVGVPRFRVSSRFLADFTHNRVSMKSGQVHHGQWGRLKEVARASSGQEAICEAPMSPPWFAWEGEQSFYRSAVPAAGAASSRVGTVRSRVTCKRR